MDKTLYIKEEALTKTNTNIPLGVILNVKSDSNYLEKVVSLVETDKHIIKSLIIDTEYVEGMHFIEKDNVFYRFTNEEDVRDSIWSLPDEKKARIIGARLCSSGVHILSYKIIGITNIQITTPLINNVEFLRNLKSGNYRLFCTANVNSTVKGVIDPSWIRPEGLYQFDGIMEDFILETSDKTNVDFILSSYSKGESIGLIRDFIVGFENYDKRYINCPNLLNMTFDVSRLNCGADCLFCRQCERSVALAQSFATPRQN